MFGLMAHMINSNVWSDRIFAAYSTVQIDSSIYQAWRYSVFFSMSFWVFLKHDKYLYKRRKRHLSRRVILSEGIIFIAGVYNDMDQRIIKKA